MEHDPKRDLNFAADEAPDLGAPPEQDLYEDEHDVALNQPHNTSNPDKENDVDYYAVLNVSRDVIRHDTIVFCLIQPYD
jgi:hypothetical protein